MRKLVEILSPAGSYESLKAAISAGADAVYVGGSRFGARAYANNLSEEKLLEAIDYVHLHEKKIYLTINTLLKEEELKNELYDYLLPYYKQGLDAVIVQDIGVLEFVKEQFPGLSIHASTQMTITNTLGAEFLKKQGVERVVTSRELQLDEIHEIAESTGLEIESFVHGALCYCYSGQCLYSSLIGGRSGNRGQCAQPCRLPYRVNDKKETQYVLSLKDICTLEYIPELIEAGIYSFKIEGRMKKPEYVALVTAMYRKYVDLYFAEGKKNYRVDAKDRERLMDLYNRGGSHGGYYHTKNGREMLSLTRPNHAGVSALKVLRQNGKSILVKALVDIHKGDVIELPDGKENYTFSNSVKEGQNTTFITHKKQNFGKDAVLNRIRNEKLIQEIQTQIIEKKLKEKINGKLILSLTDPAKLILENHDMIVEAYGEPAQEAVNQPMNPERIEKQMRKTGNTEFEFDNLDIELKGNLFIPLQSLNELRRQGIENLQKKILEKYRRQMPEKVLYHEVCAKRSPYYKGFTVYAETLEQLETLNSIESVNRIYLDCNAIECAWKDNRTEDIVNMIKDSGKELFFAMPYIFRKNSIRLYEQSYEKILEKGWHGVLVRNYESYEFLRNHDYHGKIVMDYNMYQFNTYAKAFWMKEDVEFTTAPLELNYKELKAVGLQNSELIIYGYLPMMVSAQCVVKTTKGCKKQKERMVLKDRYQKEFVVKNHCDYCYNVIYNTSPVVLTDQKKEIMDLQPGALRLHFTIESAEEVKKIMRLYEDVFINDVCTEDLKFEFTRGHFKRGII